MGVDDDRGGRRFVYNRPQGVGGQQQQQPEEEKAQGLECLPHQLQQHNNKVCHYWRAGRCHRRPCPYLHSIAAATTSTHPNPPMVMPPPHNKPNNTWIRPKPTTTTIPIQDNKVVCRHWMARKCPFSDKCRYLHKWFDCDGLTMFAHLPGHHEAITAVALTTATASPMLFSGSNDQSIRAWNCQSVHCDDVLHMGGRVGCVITRGPWLFVGTTDAIRVLNTQTKCDLTLSGPVRQVYSLVVSDSGMLFAGTHDPIILAWTFNDKTNCFDPTVPLKGHTLGVVTLVVGANNNRLYSGSIDATIRVWDLDTLQCLQILTQHTSAVMSLLCWDHFLFSSSLDGTIKVWAASHTQNPSLEVVYTHTEQHGVLRLCGAHDAESKPVLLCSCNNNTVYLYDIPSFNERGRIFSKEEVRSMEGCPGGFITGDATGDLRVWKWSKTEAA